MAKWKNRLLLTAIETTYGTAPTLAGTDAILIKEIDVVPIEIELKDRELIRGSFGNSEKVISGRMSKASFTVEFAGSGTVAIAPKWGPCLRACGFSETIVSATPGPGSVTYAPVSTSQESAAFAFYADGVLHVIRGARGTVSFSLSAGEIPDMKFEFTGLYTAATTTANPAATFTRQAKPLAVNSANTATVSVHGYAACLQSLELNLANNVVFRQLAGCTESVEITDRVPAGSASVECPALASKDYFAALSSQALGELSFTHGATAGNILALTMPQVNIGGVSYTDNDGVMMLDLTYMPNPTSGNDEIELVLT